MNTLHSILSEPRFAHLSVINEHADLQRTVGTIDTTETPDAAQFVERDTLVLTTAMAFEHDQRGLIEFIRALNAVPIAGMGIKTNRFLKNLQPEVIAEADRLGFPLILIPENSTLGHLSHQLLTYLWNNSTEQLVYAINTQKQFSQLFIEDATVKDLVSEISGTLNRPVILLDPFLQPHTVAPRRHVLGEQMRSAIAQAILEQGAHTRHRTTNIGAPLNSAQGWAGDVAFTVYPIVPAPGITYHLAVMKSESLAYPVSHLAIEMASQMIAFTLFRQMQERKTQVLNDLQPFLRLLNPGPETVSDDEIAHCHERGLNRGSRYQVIVLRFRLMRGAEIRESLRAHLLMLIDQYLTRELGNSNPDTMLLADLENMRIVLILQDQEPDAIDHLAMHFDLIESRLGIQITAGVGYPVITPSSIQFSYAEARQALAQETSVRRERVLFCESDGIRELTSFASAEFLHLFVGSTLGPLANAEQDDMVTLAQTLKCHLDHQCNITATSEHLNVHRNTIKYRLRRIEQVLGRDITQPNYNLRLRMALSLLGNQLS